jgi:hypothetical protein
MARRAFGHGRWIRRRRRISEHHLVLSCRVIRGRRVWRRRGLVGILKRLDREVLVFGVLQREGDQAATQGAVHDRSVLVLHANLPAAMFA